MTKTVFFLLLLHGTKRRRPDEADVPHTLSQCVTPNCIRGAWPTGLLFERTCTVCSMRGFCYLPRPRGPARNLIFFRRIKPPPPTPPLLIIQHPPGTDSDGSNGRHLPVENPILLYMYIRRVVVNIAGGRRGSGLLQSLCNFKRGVRPSVCLCYALWLILVTRCAPVTWNREICNNTEQLDLIGRAMTLEVSVKTTNWIYEFKTDIYFYYYEHEFKIKTSLSPPPHQKLN